MFDRLGELASEHAELERALADPGLHADPDKARDFGRRYAELTPIVHAYTEWQATEADEAAARELGAEDASFAAEADQLKARRAELGEQLRRMLAPRDPNDGRDVILEIKAGEGGDESALFAGDLLRMYQRYAERHRWATEVLDSTVTGLGGVKAATLAVKAGKRGLAIRARAGCLGAAEVRRRRAPGPAGPGHRVSGPHPHLGRGCPGHAGSRAGRGRHRPERRPGRRVPVLRPGRPEREHHRLRRPPHPHPDRHRRLLPEREEPAAEQGAGDAILRARLLAQAQHEADEKAAAGRRSQVRTVDRSERVRTYNFPENRISDHRVGYKAYNLDQVIDGDLDAVIDSLADAEMAEKLGDDGNSGDVSSGSRAGEPVAG